jgi:putative nucleotidyltransferase with HDIG domain
MSDKDDAAILLVDDDDKLCVAVANVLASDGYRTISAQSGDNALELFNKHKPKLVISDVRMPGIDGIQLLVEIHKLDPIVPVIMATGYPDLDSAIQAIHNGAYDYLVKPFQPEMLLQKVRQALNSSALEKENIVLSRLASLHEITNELASIHDLDELLDFTLAACLRILKAQSGSIQLVDKDSNELVIVRRKGVQSPVERSPLSDPDQWPISKWVANKGRSLLITSKATVPPAILPFNRTDIGSALSVPLKVSEEVIGVVNLNREETLEPLTTVDQDTIDVFASQASIAISNARLYSSLNQKLKELSLISRYSEELMARVDRIDVIRCLFETVFQHFPVDVTAFLLVRKRFHEFLYWSRGRLKQDDIEHMLSDALQAYNKAANAKIQRKRVTPRQLVLPKKITGTVKLPFAFSHRIAVMWEDLSFGLAYFGSMKEPADRNDIISLLQSLVNQTRIALTSTKLYDDVKENYIRTIKALAIAVDAKDTYTHGHSENVMNIAESIASEMRMDAKVAGIIRDAGLLHDIGKIGIPGYILNKPGPLTYEEFNGVMKTHTTLGANIVKDVPFLRDLYFLILCHHEHYDGTGYPEGRKGEEIPVGARILHVADAFEAMTSNRPYRTSLGRKEALKRLMEEKGKQFDPDVVEAFIKVAKRKGWVE